MAKKKVAAKAKKATVGKPNLDAMVKELHFRAAMEAMDRLSKVMGAAIKRGAPTLDERVQDAFLNETIDFHAFETSSPRKWRDW